jgi:hypothetical protein
MVRGTLLHISSMTIERHACHARTVSTRPGKKTRSIGWGPTPRLASTSTGVTNRAICTLDSTAIPREIAIRLGLLTTGFCLLAFLVLGTPWLLFVAG